MEGICDAAPGPQLLANAWLAGGFAGGAGRCALSQPRQRSAVAAGSPKTDGKLIEGSWFR